MEFLLDRDNMFEPYKIQIPYFSFCGFSGFIAVNKAKDSDPFS